MLIRWRTLALLCLLELTLLVAAHGDHAHAGGSSSASGGEEAMAKLPQDSEGEYYRNTSMPENHAGHSHMHAGAPKTVLNETALLLKKGPSPLSYLELDAGLGADLSDAYGSHYGTMVLHGFFMTLAFAIALPLFIFFRIAKHALLAGVSQATFLASLGLGMITGLSYSASTPNLYKNQKHGGLGWIIFFLALGLSSAQIVRTAVILFLKRDKEVPFTSRLKHLIKTASSQPDEFEAQVGDYELVGRQSSELLYDAEHSENPPHSANTLVDEEEDLQRRTVIGNHQQTHQSIPESRGSMEYKAQYWRRPHRQEISLDLQRHGGGHDRPAPRAYREDSHGGESSRTASSDETLHETYADGQYTLSPGTISPPGPYPFKTHLEDRSEVRVTRQQPRSRKETLAGIVKYGEIFLWRVMVLMGWTAFMTGCITYWGGCRSPYINACLAHEIKGSIFFWYGVLTFGRYCGSWAELGWAWNRKPKVEGSWREHAPSAEMVESFVIWLYGATNTWMERFGAGLDDPWTLHQVQHVSIAVMFFFAGSAGMILESKTCRNWISGAILNRSGKDKAAEPASYSSSFNIFPALTVGITGLAMSAHHQEYAFSVSIHALWGNLLAGFAICRILTYTFLHLRPPASILPSRPPTEALGAFCLCAGGIVFMLSTEEVIFWAMRHGFDDMMTFLNATVAFVCAVLSWTLVLMALKGWATRRLPVGHVNYQSLDPQFAASRKIEANV